MIIIEKSIYLRTLGQYIFYLNSLKYVLNQASSTFLHCRSYDHKVGRILDLVSLLYNHNSANKGNTWEKKGYLLHARMDWQQVGDWGHKGKQEKHWESSPEGQQKSCLGVRGPCVSPARETWGEAEQLMRAHVPSLPGATFALQVSANRILLKSSRSVVWNCSILISFYCWFFYFLWITMVFVSW